MDRILRRFRKDPDSKEWAQSRLKGPESKILAPRLYPVDLARLDPETSRVART